MQSHRAYGVNNNVQMHANGITTARNVAYGFSVHGGDTSYVVNQLVYENPSQQAIDSSGIYCYTEIPSPLGQQPPQVQQDVRHITV